MPAAVGSDVRPTVETDDLDDIFNYDAGIDATFNEANRDRSVHNEQNGSNMDAPINIDEEVVVTKKRKPVAKLDEERLIAFTPTLSRTAVLTLR